MGEGATARVLTASGQTTTVTRTSTAPPAHSRLTEEQPEVQQRRRRQRPRQQPPQLVSCRAVGVADSLNSSSSSNLPLTWQLLVRPRQRRPNTTSTISSPFQTLSQSHQVSCCNQWQLLTSGVSSPRQHALSSSDLQVTPFFEFQLD